MEKYVSFFLPTLYIFCTHKHLQYKKKFSLITILGHHSLNLLYFLFLFQIRDKKWEEEETRPWWYRKSSPSSTVTTASSQPQVDSTDLGSIQTASTSLLLGSGGGCNGARNLTVSILKKVQYFAFNIYTIFNQRMTKSYDFFPSFSEYHESFTAV